MFGFNTLSANPTKWSNTLKQFVGKLPTNCLSVFDHFVKLALKGLKSETQSFQYSHITYKDQYSTNNISKKLFQRKPKL